MSVGIDGNVIGFFIWRKDVNVFSTFGKIEDKIEVLMESIDWQNNDKYESYSLNESTKSYTICSENCKISVLFHFDITVNQMRFISTKTLNSLLKDKYIWPQI